MTSRRTLLLMLLGLVAGLSWQLGSPRQARAADAAKVDSGAKAAADAMPIVYVDRSLGWAVYDGWESRAPTLFRELARQALLIAARDELGLATRDPWLASDLPATGDNPPFEIIATARDSLASLEVLRGFGGRQEVVLKLPFEVKALERDAPRFVVGMEAASRGAFVDLLKKLGFQARVAAPSELASAAAEMQTPDATEDLLGELNEYSQFSALRAIHAALRKGPETPLLLGQLVRGYAQLGMLTELCWSPAHKVFKARALLYAQRMRAKYPSPAALDHLAFAEAFCGLPGAALETLAKAKAASEAASPPAGEGGQPPAGVAEQHSPWRAALDAYCRLDTTALDKMCAEGEVQSLACFLKFLALEQSGCDPMAMEYGTNLLQAMPLCARVYAGLNRMAGVGLGHFVTEAAPAAFAQDLVQRLPRLPGLPANVVASLGATSGKKGRAAPEQDAWKLEAAAITALLAGGRSTPPGAPPDAGGDPNELRWETLGLVLREISFEQVWRRSRFLRSMLGVSGDDWLAETRPLADIHPYGAYLQLHHWRRADGEPFLPAARKAQPLGIELPGVWLGYELQYFDQAKGQEFMNEAFNNCDETAFELTQKMTWTNDDGSLDGRAGRLLAVSPHSPIAQARLVVRAFDQVRDRADEWEKAAARHPRLAMGFAKHYLASDPDRAEMLLRPAAALSHEMAAYTQLADIYEKQGKEARFVATLEEFLKQPAFGLEHAMVQVQIADHFINKGEWATAKPYADGAAQSYSAWGLYKAANVHEALREWAEAEQYYQAVSQRYRGENLSWYRFCKRTGHGDEDAARAVAKAYVETGDLPAWMIGSFYELEGQHDKALAKIEQASKEETLPFFHLRIALLADQEKKLERRDKALGDLVVLGKKLDKNKKVSSGADLAALAELFIADLAQGGKAAFDPADVEKRLMGEVPRSQSSFHWFLGSYLDRCGRPDAAIEQWKQCLACPILDLDSRTLAGAALVEHEILDTDYENPLLKAKPTTPQP